MYKLITRVTPEYGDKIREALANAGAGKYPHYSHCSFTAKGIGRFMGDEKSNPTIGMKGKIMEIEEEQIEVLIQENTVKEVVSALKKVHPYEEIPIEIYKLENTYEF